MITLPRIDPPLAQRISTHWMPWCGPSWCFPPVSRVHQKFVAVLVNSNTQGPLSWCIVCSCPSVPLLRIPNKPCSFSCSICLWPPLCVGRVHLGGNPFCSPPSPTDYSNSGTTDQALPLRPRSFTTDKALRHGCLWRWARPSICSAPVVDMF